MSLKTLMIGRTKLLALVLICMGFISCTPIVVQPDVPCPNRPTLAPITVAEQILIDPQVIRKLADNQLAMKEYAKKLEVRANCE